MKRFGRSGKALGIAAVLMAALVLVSVQVGSFPLSSNEIWDILAGGRKGTTQAQVLWTLRLPRVWMGLLAGGALGLAVADRVWMLENASGASLGAACAIVLGAGTSAQIMGGAFLMGMASLVLVLALVRWAGLERTGTYILAGVIISSAADAGLMVLKTVADPEGELAAIEFWTMGSLAAMTADKVWPAAAAILIPALLIFLFRQRVLILSMGEESARTMGRAPGPWRSLLLGLTTLMVAAVVSVAGVVAFVGLIAPHIAFLLLGRRGGPYLPLCALVGGDILLAADLLARSLAGGGELPLSIWTVCFGVPVLLALLVGQRGGRDG